MDYNNNYPTKENFLFGAAKLTKNADIDKSNILDMVVGLIDVELFHFLPVDLVAM